MHHYMALPKIRTVNADDVDKAGPVQMDPSGKSKGPPPAVKKVLSLFGSGREEDRMVGYLSFLKIGPKLLKFLPGTAGTPFLSYAEQGPKLLKLLPGTATTSFYPFSWIPEEGHSN